MGSSLLHVRLLGTFNLDYEGEPVTRVDTPRLQSLLAYLLLNAEAPQQRQYIAFRFWPDSTEKQARTNLRQLLHHLRQALPDADRLIDTRTHTLQWQPSVPFMLDVEAFGQALARAEVAREQGHPETQKEALEEAVDLYRGDLLPNCYDEWIEPERERLRQQYMMALDRLVGLLEQARAYLEAILHARSLLQKDALRETAYRTLMRLHALRNDRASALRVYHECATVMDRELGVSPGPATRALYERLMNLQTPTAHLPRDHPGQKAAVPLVGRHPEWKQLRRAWRTATNEGARMVLIAGEAGIGKSRLAEELLTWAARQGVTTARTRCYAAEGRLAFAPIADWLRAEPFRRGIDRLDAIWRAEVARILPELLADGPDLSRPEPLTESWQRRRFFEALARAVLRTGHPMVLLIDDLQWCDQDTLEWLHYLLRFDAESPWLLIGTVRIEEVGPTHPLTAFLLDLRCTGQVTEIMLGPLDADETKELAEYVAAKTLAPHQAAALHQETEGNPFFVVESVRASHMEGADTPSMSASSSTNPGPLPPSVHAILTARLAQCSPLARDLAHVAAVVGRAFTYEVLAAASGRDEDTLIQSLDELWQRRIIREYGSHTYDFSHDKLREVAYGEMSPVRQRRLHRSVAEALKTCFANTLDLVSGQVASHYERAGLPEEAIPYYRQAAQVAQGVYANEEAISYLEQALALLDGCPASLARATSKLGLLVLLGSSVAATRGYAASETGHIYARARTLCRPEDDVHLLFPVYWGSYGFHLVRAELRKAHTYSEQCLRLAEAEEDPALLVAAHFAMGVSLAHLGETPRARAHLEKAQGRYDPGQHHFQMGTDPGVFSRAYSAHTLWLLGYPEQALQRGREALAMAEAMTHPFSQVIALSYLAMLHQFRREHEAVLAHAEAVLALTAVYGFPYYEAWAGIMKGWALHRQGRHRAGRSGMEEGLQALRTIGTGVRAPYYLALLAEAHQVEGTLDEGLGLVDEALHIVARTEERWQEAELHRLRGDLLRSQDAAQAEASYHQALCIARQQAARSLELRVALRLSRLWHRQHHPDEARQLLQPVCDAFSEGFDTPDLLDAHSLLDDLS